MTVRRRLQEAGLRYSLPLSKPFLTLKHQQDRLQWVKLVQNVNSDNVLATDETTFRLNSVRHMHWDLPDKEPKHRSHLSKDWKMQHGIKKLPCAPFNPHMNPMGNLW
ncbi:unnamed protein product [Rotaria sp. Silwood2]|nr:unnamed protein product [Rotaria sp. Silwood2]CAF4137431.1 unnamed protein product [Rotaria sp. Silwood2]